MRNASRINDQVSDYYSKKITLHGATPHGVDWNSLESQKMRFEQLIKLFKEDSEILDFGCGYGGLFDFLMEGGFEKIHYTGYDISREMIAQALKRHANEANANWILDMPSDAKFDYVVASGVFNVRLDIDTENWESYIFSTLKELDDLSVSGFAFNLLTTYSDKHLMQDHLYYASPERIFKYCKENFSKSITILHDYPLYEFTTIVRKNIL